MNTIKKSLESMMNDGVIVTVKQEKTWKLLASNAKITSVSGKASSFVTITIESLDGDDKGKIAMHKVTSLASAIGDNVRVYVK